MKKIGLSRNAIRMTSYPIVAFLSFYLLIKFTSVENFDKKEILSILISVISIIIAIIVTYLFSKLFIDKTIKIERKKKIDKISIKVTDLRRIAFYLRNLYGFWRFNDSDIKSAIDHKYPNLTYEEYRGIEVPGNRQISPDEYNRISEDIGDVSGQAYLALKGLENGEESYSFFSDFHPINYSLNDIARFKNYANSFWYLLDRSSDDVVNFRGCSRFWLRRIDELYYKILGKQIDPDNYKNDIKNLFSEFESVFFQKHYYLNSMNSNNLSQFYITGLKNMGGFVIILICAVFGFAFDLSQIVGHACSIILLSFFISNTVDLMIITILSIKSELEIDEIFSI